MLDGPASGTPVADSGFRYGISGWELEPIDPRGASRWKRPWPLARISNASPT